jgi:hypothetical protein
MKEDKKQKKTQKQKDAELEKNIREEDYIEEIITKGKKKGYMTFDEINDMLPDDFSTENLDEVIAIFDDLDIPVIDGLHTIRPTTRGLFEEELEYEEDYEEKIYAQTVEAPPGTVWAYASVPVDMLSLIIEDVTDQRLEDFFSEHIGNVIGIGDIKWGRFNNHTGGSGGPEGGARFPARELARVGYLVLNDGLWERNGKKEQVISKERIREFTQKAPWLEKTTWRPSNFAEKDSNLFYSHLWWNNSTGQALGETAPRDTIFMSGWGKQACFVVPSLDMIVVRLGPNGSLNQNTKFYHELWERIMSSIIRKE